LQRVQVCGCVLPTYCAMGHFEGAALATERTPWWRRLWHAKTCRKITNVWCVYILVHIKLVI